MTSNVKRVGFYAVTFLLAVFGVLSFVTIGSASAVPPNSVNPAGGYSTMYAAATHPQRVVRVPPGTPAYMRDALRNVISQINSAAGMNLVTFGPDLPGVPTAHEILVRAPQPSSCVYAWGSGIGCFDGSAVWSNGQMVMGPSIVEVNSSAVTAGWLLPVLLHEMGHAIGLGHYDAQYGGTNQIMNSFVTPGVNSYQQGDRNGIRDLVNSYNTPFGSMDAARQNGLNRVNVRGWAVDSNDSYASLQLHAYVDGRYAGAGTTTTSRRDVSNTFYGVSPTSGYDFNLNSIPAGRRNVCVYAINIGLGSANPLLGCRTITVGGNPFGNLDSARVETNGTLTAGGWVIDPDTASPINVHVYLNGGFYQQTVANRSRADIGKAYPTYGPGHGYRITIPNIPKGNHTLCVYAINVGVGSTNPLLGCRTVTR